LSRALEARHSNSHPAPLCEWRIYGALFQTHTLPSPSGTGLTFGQPALRA